MASLKHEIVNSPRVKEALKYNAQHMRLKTTAKKTGGKNPTQRMPTVNTLQQYITHAVKFGGFCKQTYGCRHFEDCSPHIQDYADHLVKEGKSAATIHTYLAGVCFVFDVPLEQIKKPIRHAADATRSRGHKKSDRRKDTKAEYSPRLSKFVEAVHIRRHECQSLRQDCLTVDESGYLCVDVRKGKGGKQQLQRVPFGSEELVRSYFDGDAEKFVFSKEEMGNKLDLHHHRHMGALKAYRGYEQRLKDDPTYREQLIREIKDRWRKFNARTLPEHELSGNYIMRGRNRELAKRYGFQYSFDRLAVLATSIFHLAHWRTNVTVVHYLLPALLDEAMEQNEENNSSSES